MTENGWMTNLMEEVSKQSQMGLSMMESLDMERNMEKENTIGLTNLIIRGRGDEMSSMASVYIFGPMEESIQEIGKTT